MGFSACGSIGYARTLRGPLAVGGLLFTLGHASGQVGPPAAQAAGAPSDQLSEIVVTARRVEERQQATPISVTSVSADTLKALDITKLAGLDNVVPNVTITEGVANGMGAIVYIRGIGAISVAAYSDPPVSIYIDGVVQARPTGNAFDLPDVDHIEVLRGPQGTLFGRNTTGGAVAIYTKKPAPVFGGFAEIGYGNYNEVIADLVLNTGELFHSGWLAKLVFQLHDYDGWVNTPGRSRSDWFGYYRSKAGSFSLSKQVGDDFTIDNRAFIDYERDKPAYQLTIVTPTAAAVFGQSASLGGPPLIVSGHPLDINYQDPRNLYDPSASSWGDTLTLTYDVNDYLSLKSITGYRSLTQSQTGQLGGSFLLGRVGTTLANLKVMPVEYNTPLDSVIEDQESEEFQATGRVGAFNYVAGLYYFHETINEDQFTNIPLLSTALPIGPHVSGFTSALITYTLPSTSYAAYANVGYRPAFFDDKMELTGGVRYTLDQKDETAHRVLVGAAPITPQMQSQTWHNVGWSASANYQWTGEIMTYARGSSAYRAGGYNPAQVPAPPFAPETAKQVEAGFKTEWFDHRVRLNGAGFKTFYDNLQISQRNAQSGITYVINAGSATFTGFELEGEAVLGGGLRLNGSVGYVDAEYQTFIQKDSHGNPINLASVAKFPMVAPWTFNIGGQYQAPETAIGVLTGVVNFAFQSTHVFAPLDSLAPNNEANKSGEIRNLKASLILSELPITTGVLKDVKVEAYADNLLNNRYILSGPDLGTYATGAFNRPRSYGVRLSADY